MAGLGYRPLIGPIIGVYDWRQANLRWFFFLEKRRLRYETPLVKIFLLAQTSMDVAGGDLMWLLGIGRDIYYFCK
jgi:hypothetical protein